MMFLSRSLEAGAQNNDGGGGVVASHNVFNPFARRHFSHPSSVQSVHPLKKGSELVIGKQLNTNHHVLWADPALHEQIDSRQTE
jgi:hypothetical protein